MYYIVSHDYFEIYMQFFLIFLHINFKGIFGDEINVDIDETNVSISDIKVYRMNQGVQRKR